MFAEWRVVGVGGGWGGGGGGQLTISALSLFCLE